MAHPSNSCPKCDGTMSQGFMLDNSYGGNLVGTWVAGHPEKSFWTKIKAPSKDQIPVAAFRCESCGFLEFFAMHEFGPK